MTMIRIAGLFGLIIHGFGLGSHQVSRMPRVPTSIAPGSEDWSL